MNQSRFCFQECMTISEKPIQKAKRSKMRGSKNSPDLCKLALKDLDTFSVSDCGWPFGWSLFRSLLEFKQISRPPVSGKRSQRTFSKILKVIPRSDALQSSITERQRDLQERGTRSAWFEHADVYIVQRKKCASGLQDTCI